MTEKKTTKKLKALKEEKIVQAAMPKKEATGKSKYIFAVGRRKTAKARVKLFVGGSGMITVNGRQFENYFPTLQLQKDATDALNTSGLLKKVDVEASTNGGGVNAQAKAIRLGIARALVVLDPAFKTVLKKEGYMTRDARKKERKKPGLKRARRAPQWQKR